MRSKKLFQSLCFIFIIVLTQQNSFAQQQVDVSAFEESYKGGFFKVDVGLTMGSISYGNDIYPILDGDKIIPLYFDFVAGKRLSRAIAPYILVYGHVLLKETSSLSSLSQAGFNVGSNFYLKNPNAYIAPEIGLALLTMEAYIRDNLNTITETNSYSDNMGLKLAVKWGRDFHISGKMFFGTNLYLSYFTAKSNDTESNKGNGFFYGVNFSLKYGK
jgi:hypothetical protein